MALILAVIASEYSMAQEADLQNEYSLQREVRVKEIKKIINSSNVDLPKLELFWRGVAARFTPFCNPLCGSQEDFFHAETPWLDSESRYLTTPDIFKDLKM